MQRMTKSRRFRETLLRTINESLNAVTRKFEELDFNRLQSHYREVEASLEDECAKDPVCLLELKRRVSELRFRAFLLKEQDTASIIRAFKDLVSFNHSEDIRILWFALMLTVNYPDGRYRSYLCDIMDEYEGRVAETTRLLSSELRKIRRRRKTLANRAGRKPGRD
jgi:hypothetical protein